MKEYKHLGSYGIIISNNKVLLIKKANGPYAGKLDLPGGTIELNEKPIETLKRELNEEVGIELVNYELIDADSVSFDWTYKDTLIKVHHIGIFYKVLEYKNDIKKELNIDDINDDSLGADFYEIDKLSKKDLSLITILVLEKMGYKLK